MKATIKKKVYITEDIVYDNPAYQAISKNVKWILILKEQSFKYWMDNK